MMSDLLSLACVQYALPTTRCCYCIDNGRPSQVHKEARRKNRFGHAPNQLKMSHGHFSHYSSTDTTAVLCFDAEINIFF